MEGITNYVTRPQTAVNTAAGGASQQGERQAGAEVQEQAVRKEQALINQVAQYQARGNEAEGAKSSPAPAAKSIEKATASSATETTSSTARTDRAPNWSQLSAHVHGYTHIQRAMNLYQHINKLV